VVTRWSYIAIYIANRVLNPTVDFYAKLYICYIQIFVPAGMGCTWDISVPILVLSKSIMTRESFLYQSHVETYVKFCSRTMVSGGLGPKSLIMHAVYPSRVPMPHLHTMGEMDCAWFGKIPVVERENHGDDATLHQLCLLLSTRTIF
jgi:hypothetical protein